VAVPRIGAPGGRLAEGAPAGLITLAVMAVGLLLLVTGAVLGAFEGDRRQVLLQGVITIFYGAYLGWLLVALRRSRRYLSR
jgi:threonine/homoserine/homoserine lactone efflux protein